MCHFHQKRIIPRYITKHPKLEASQELKKTVSTLTKTIDLTFTIKHDKWFEKYKEFLNQSTKKETSLTTY
jgi:hypothetical protein